MDRMQDLGLEPDLSHETECDHELAEVVAEVSAAPEATSGTTDAERLRLVIESLDRVDRLVTLLYFADELSTHEIAAVTDVPTSDVEACIERVRASASKVLRTHVATTG